MMKFKDRHKFFDTHRDDWKIRWEFKFYAVRFLLDSKFNQRATAKK